MAAILSNLRNASILGTVLAVVLIVWAAQSGASPSGVELGLMRYLHVVSGVMWIGLLWYFNFVQIPTMPKVPAELKGGVTKFIAPEALFWFRWAALATIVLGLILALHSSSYSFADAFTLGMMGEGVNVAASIIGIGMYLGLIMGFNVWFVIWPNQQKALNIGGKFSDLTPEQKLAAGKTAMIFSRINTMLSVPMLFCMVGAMHI